jgi:CheY-like chemotaxis protein
MIYDDNRLRGAGQPASWMGLGGLGNQAGARSYSGASKDRWPGKRNQPANARIYDSRIRVLIVDDHPLMRKMMREVLELDEAIDVVASAKDGDEALAMLDAIRPDVIVLDFAMPGANGIDVMAEIREHSDYPVLIVSIHAQPYLVERARRAGAHGYLPKIAATHSLAPAIHAVSEGRPYFRV